MASSPAMVGSSPMCQSIRRPPAASVTRLAAVGDDTGEVDRLALHLRAAGAGEVEQVVDQLAHLGTGSPHRGQVALGVGRELARCLAFEHLGVAGDMAQRRAQVVRYRRGKGIELAVGRLDLLRAQRERRIQLEDFALAPLVFGHVLGDAEQIERLVPAIDDRHLANAQRARAVVAGLHQLLGNLERLRSGQDFAVLSFRLLGLRGVEEIAIGLAANLVLRVAAEFLPGLVQPHIAQVGSVLDVEHARDVLDHRIEKAVGVGHSGHRGVEAAIQHAQLVLGATQILVALRRRIAGRQQQVEDLPPVGGDETPLAVQVNLDRVEPRVFGGQPAVGKQVADALEQQPVVVWLEHETVGAALQAADHVERVRERRHQDHRHAAQRRVGLDMPGQLAAVHLRHADIADDDVGHENRRLLERQPAVGADRHLEAVLLQQVAQALRLRRAVLGNQHPQRPGAIVGRIIHRVFR